MDENFKLTGEFSEKMINEYGNLFCFLSNLEYADPDFNLLELDAFLKKCVRNDGKVFLRSVLQEINKLLYDDCYSLSNFGSRLTWQKMSDVKNQIHDFLLKIDNEKKVIFLDFDGVLNSGDNSHVLNRLAFDNPEIMEPSIEGFEFDERCVRWLKYIINRTDAKIVISSSWRLDYKLEKLQTIWKEFNLPGEVIGYTPSNTVSFLEEQDLTSDFERGKEILSWLTENKVDSYCIIDDDFDVLPDQVFVQTDPEFGLTYETAELVVEYLNRQ
ncbi:MAG: HAD domain-containing protein [Bacteroidales bacterium]|jgi:hypothetical protein